MKVFPPFPRVSRNRLRRFLRRTGAAGLVFCAGAALALAWPMDVEHYLRPAPSGLLLDRDGEILFAALNQHGQWLFPVPLERVSPRLIQATVAAEDQRFFSHFGLDVFALCRALWTNLRGGTFSGASTISMQVVKLADAGPGVRMTVRGKVRQMLQAVRLELRAGKDDILEAYLNAAPYVDNVRGCEAASRRLFNKPARELSRAEAALLAGLPKAPARFDPRRRPDRARQRRRYVLDRLGAEGLLSIAEIKRLHAVPVYAQTHPFPRMAAHLALSSEADLQTGRAVRSTLDVRAQEALERRLRGHVEYFEKLTHGGVSNGAAIVLDAPTGEIRAYAGSARFFDTPGGGQFDAASAPRPPGSALKPFLYAQAMRLGRLHPEEVLFDAPMDRGLYNPRNFGEVFDGRVSAAEALRGSLNIPALALLGRVGVADFMSELQALGFSHVTQPPDHYGLGLALGACGVELAELAGAYGTLARNGEYRAPRWLRDAPTTAPRRVLPADVCMQIHRILERPLPDDGVALDGAERAPLRASWKTGTSTGRHDAWTALYDGRFVVAVWMGRNDYAPHPSLVGANAALPLASALFREIGGGVSQSPRIDPAVFRPLRICAVSGLPANPECPAVREVLTPRSVGALRICDVHHRPPADWKGEDAPALVEYWPADPLSWDLASTPRAAPRTAVAPSVKGLEILNPGPDARFVRTGAHGGDRILLRASLSDRTAIHWYQDGRYLGASSPEEPLGLHLEPGAHRLSCMTPDGAVAFVDYEVETGGTF